MIRPYSHSLSDDEKLYKTKDERADEAQRDPISRMAAFLTKEGLASEGELEALLKDVEREVNEAADAAIKAEKPSPSTATLYVYSPDVDPASDDFQTEPQPEGKPDTMVAAINRTMKDEMARDAAHRRVRRGRRGRQPGIGARIGARARAAFSR